MQKNDKYYTFLLKRSSKKGIYIKRIALQKSAIHFGSIGLFLILGLSGIGFGISGFVKTTVFAQNLESNSERTFENSPVVAKVAAIQPTESQPINYSRPQSSDDLSFNSGGPETIDENDNESGLLEAQIAQLKATMLPANIPNSWAVLGKINNEFGFRRNPFGGRSYEFHSGMDIDGERGDSVFAPGGGTVVKAGWSGGYGNMIEIEHGSGVLTRYGHLSKVDVAVGDTVTRSQLIGYVGSTGRSTGPHLHFEFRLNERSINPRHFLPQEPVALPTAK